MTEVRAPRSGRSLSSSKVTVATSQKRQAKNAPFKFLRKDEGRLSYSCALDSPTSAGGPTSQGNSTSNRELLVMDRRRSRSLREAIANDMRKGKVNDPFGSMVVAVPKRALPLTSALPSEDHPSPDRAPLQESWPSPSPQPPQHQSGAVPVAAMEPTQRETNGGQMVIERPSDLCESDEGDTVVERHLQRPQQQQLQQSRPHHTRQEGQPVLHQAQSVQQPVGHRIETVRSHSSMGYTAEGTPRDLSPAVSQQRRWRNGDRESIAPLRPQSRRYNDMCDLEDDYSRSNRNYFRAPMPEYRQSREEVEIVGQLEDELHAAKEERSRYYQLRMQLERERQRFEEYRSGVEQDIEDERAELDAVRASEKRQAKKDVKVVEERYKSTLELLKTERESNAKLTQENEVLRQHLEVMTARLRESQKLQKVETNRLRREIESLTRRNEELLELARDQQLAALESGAMLVTPPLTHAIPNTRYQVMSSNSGIQRSSVESYEAHSFAVQPGRSNAQHQRHYKDLTESDQGLVGNKAEGRRVVAGGSERGGEVDGKRFEEEEEDCEGRRSAGAEAEERERKRVELEERRRVDAEEKERKRIEAEERERKRVELEERRRVDAEEKERKRIEAEERERKRVELEERRRVDAEEGGGKAGKRAGIGTAQAC
ncbi:hypothetical protein ERJ75_000991500 [Trypanosoma vivax]|nr:hypothetical protein ERJ75_000991500 [Trypanosoma vivax]